MQTVCWSVGEKERQHGFCKNKKRTCGKGKKEINRKKGKKEKLNKETEKHSKFNKETRTKENEETRKAQEKRTKQ
jgi:hypothetical protein